MYDFVTPRFCCTTVRQLAVCNSYKAMINPSCRARASVAPPQPPLKGQLQARLLKHSNPQAIAKSALLKLTLRVEPQAAIGEHSINIEHKKLELCQKLLLPMPMPFTQKCSHKPTLRPDQPALVMEPQQTVQLTSSIHHWQHGNRFAAVVFIR